MPGDNKNTTIPVWHMCQVITKQQHFHCHICQVTTKPQDFQCGICAWWQQNHKTSSVAYVPVYTKTTSAMWDLINNHSSVTYGPGENKKPTLSVLHMCQVSTKPQHLKYGICARWKQNHNHSSVGDSKTTTLPVWHMCTVTTKPQHFQCGISPRWQQNHNTSSVA